MWRVVHAYRSREKVHGMQEKDRAGTPGKIRSQGSGDMDGASGPTSKALARYVDEAMFTAEPINADEGPKVHLLWMTPDPLGAIAAAAKMYKGEVVRDLADVTDEERIEFFEQIQKTHLKAPFEFVQFHFMIEGVTRAFTHQMVRQRMATYAQESLRFAVKEDMPVGLPPSLVGTTAAWKQHEAFGWTSCTDEGCGGDRDCEDCTKTVALYVADQMVREPESERQRWAWDMAVDNIESKYQYLVNSGMPAEDARGLLPTNVLTRLHYRTDLRALLEHAGNRLCTQAQFEWRLVFTRIVEAIRGKNILPYDPDEFACFVGPQEANGTSHVWMADKIADLFRPICYQTGKCEFRASFDRKCSIRNRVDANHEIGRGSAQWGEEHDAVEGNPLVSGVGPESVVRNESGRPVFIGAIQPAEWLLEPGAAR